MDKIKLFFWAPEPRKPRTHLLTMSLSRKWEIGPEVVMQKWVRYRRRMTLGPRVRGFDVAVAESSANAKRKLMENNPWYLQCSKCRESGTDKTSRSSLGSTKLKRWGLLLFLETGADNLRHAHRVGGNKWGDRESHLSHVHDTWKRLEEVKPFSVIRVGVLCNSALFIVSSLFHSSCAIGLSHSEPQMANGTVEAFGGAGTIQSH